MTHLLRPGPKAIGRSWKRIPKTRNMLALVDGMSSRGVPITRVGFQMHVIIDWPSISAIESSLKAVADRGLKVKFTELGVSMKNAYSSFTLERLSGRSSAITTSLPPTRGRCQPRSGPVSPSGACGTPTAGSMSSEGPTGPCCSMPTSRPSRHCRASRKPCWGTELHGCREGWRANERTEQTLSVRYRAAP